MAKQTGQSKWEQHTNALSEAEKAEAARYFQRVEQHLQLPGAPRRQLMEDHERALCRLLDEGVPFSQALERLAPEKLGGFYSRPADTWYALDNAAKIYPLSMSHDQMAVFRLSVYLDREVWPELLQMALTYTVKRFPFFATTVKKGFFWHYIDSTKRRFPVEPERDIPCADMDVSLSGAPSFRVLYYKNRISAEFFHILTDGTGGLVFLKSLTAEYLRLLGHPVPAARGVLDIAQVPDPAESANDFDKCFVPGQTGGFADRPALQLGGKLSRLRPCQILHFELPEARLRAAARERGVSVTALTAAMMFNACRSATDRQRGPIHIQIPVNMRAYFKSRTLRNFSLYTCLRLPLEEIGTLKEVLPQVALQLREGTSLPAMQGMMNSAVRLVRSLRLIPLFVKAPFARIIYGFLGDRAFTATLSNLGRVELPEEMAAHVEKMDFVLGTVALARAACSMITAGDTAVFTVAKLTADPSFEERMYALFQELGIDPKVTGSELYAN